MGEIKHGSLRKSYGEGLRQAAEGKGLLHIGSSLFVSGGLN